VVGRHGKISTEMGGWMASVLKTPTTTDHPQRQQPTNQPTNQPIHPKQRPPSSTPPTHQSPPPPHKQKTKQNKTKKQKKKHSALPPQPHRHRRAPRPGPAGGHGRPCGDHRPGRPPRGWDGGDRAGVPTGAWGEGGRAQGGKGSCGGCFGWLGRGLVCLLVWLFVRVGLACLGLGWLVACGC
jgi:hypothetical protein